MTSQGSERTGAAPRHLRRRTGDRVLGGVAGGLGDYLNIDPLLIRIALVGLMIFGGAGLVLYVVGWLLIPAEGHDASFVEGVIRRVGLSAGGIGWIALAIVAFIVLQAALTPGGYVSIGPGVGVEVNVLVAILVVAVGVILLRRRSVATDLPVVLDAPANAAVAPRAPAPPRSPLAWYVSAAVLLAVGLLATISQVVERDVSPGQFFGAALVVLGIGLVVGAWWGRARILILLVFLLAPIGIVASFVTAPLEGGIGDHTFTPVTAAEVQDEYRSLGGRLTLDLSQLTTSPRDIHIAASVAVGQLQVILPERASIELHTRVGAGGVIVLGSQDVGTSLDSSIVRRHLNRTTYILDLEAGIGEVYVRYAGSF